MFDDAKHITERLARMKQVKQPFTSMMQESAELFLPRQSQFQANYQWQGQSLSQTRIFDEYAQQALEQGISIFEGFVIPRGQIWQRWELADADLMKRRVVREYIERKNLLLFSLRNDPKSGFTGQVHESVASLFAFGNQSMWPDIRRDVLGRPLGLSYKSEFFGEIYVEEDHQGLVNRIYHNFFLTAKKAEGRWGDEAPEAVKKAMKDNHGDTMIQFIHVIEPNTEYDPSRIDHVGKPWAGCFVCVDTPEVFRRGGYRSIPRIVSRMINAPNEDYGRCQAFTILPAAKATQQMMVDLMAASELAAMPPMGAHDDMLDQTIRYAAREVTYGAVDSRGNRKLVPLIEGADMSWALQLQQQLHSFIDRAFYVDMLQIRQDLKSHVTDSQLYQRDEEKGMLLAPLANQETEWFSVMLDRELDLMDELGLFDDMPPEIAEAMEAGVGLKVIYDNGLTRAQEAGAAAGYFRMLEQFAPIFQSDPTAWQIFTQKYPLEKVLDNLGRINGIPAAWEADEDEREQRAHSDQEANAIDQFVEAAPNISKVANDLQAMVPANAA